MTERTRDIEVNGVTVRIKRMDVFEQHELVNRFVPALGGVIRSVFDIQQKGANAASISTALDAFLEAVPEKTRDDIIFNKLLTKASIVASGVELPLISQKDGARAVMAETLDDISYLYEIAAQVIVFNFERFFGLGKGFLSRE